MSEKKPRFSPFVKQCFVTSAICMNIVGNGCAAGFPAILLPQLQLPGASPALTSDQASWLASITGIVMLLGAMVMMPLMRARRRTAHFAVIVPIVAGWGIIMFANSFAALLIGRSLCGISFGMLTSLRSVLVGEYTSPANRGAFLTTVTLAQAFGIFLVHLLGSFLTWRTTALISLLFHIVSIVMIIFSPESPSWLASQGKYDECRKAFHWLRGDGENEELDAMIKARMAQKILDASEPKGNRLKSIGLLIRKKEFYKPIIIMIHASFLMQCAGGTTMAAYSTKILGLIMGPAANVHFWMIFLDSQRLVFNTGAVYVINRTKRRTMLFSVGAISVASHLAIAAYITSTEGLETKSIWLPAILVNIQIFAVAVGMVPLPNVLAGELFPLEYKGIGGTINMVFISGSLFGILQTFPMLVETIGLQGTYAIYAGIMTYNLVVIWFLMPETMGKTLQQIEDEFRGRSLAPEEVEARKSLAGDNVVELQEYVSKRKQSDFTGSTPFLG